jgi:hypothetical protein
VSPVRHELVFYIPEDDILHSQCRENLKSYRALTDWTLQRRSNVSPVRHELVFCIPEDDILHSQCRENLKSYNINIVPLNCIPQVTGYRASHQSQCDSLGSDAV